MSEHAISIDKVASLARLEISTEQQEAFASQLDEILEYVDRLQAVDTSGVNAMAHAQPCVNVFRADQPAESFSPDVLTRMAPASEDHQVRVPRVVGES